MTFCAADTAIHTDPSYTCIDPSVVSKYNFMNNEPSLSVDGADDLVLNNDHQTNRQMLRRWRLKRRRVADDAAVIGYRYIYLTSITHCSTGSCVGF